MPGSQINAWAKAAVLVINSTQSSGLLGRCQKEDLTLCKFKLMAVEVAERIKSKEAVSYTDTDQFSCTDCML